MLIHTVPIDVLINRLTDPPIQTWILCGSEQVSKVTKKETSHADALLAIGFGGACPMSKNSSYPLF